MSARVAATSLIAFLALQALVHWLLMEAGPLSIDEVGYHFLTRAVAQGTPWSIFNGYEEFSSPALEVAVSNTVTPHDGRLVAKYPYLLAWLSAPLYPALGFSSMVAVNLVAHTIVLAVTWWLARRQLGSPGWALLAPLCLTIGTYFWEYAESAWPHSLAMAFTTSAFACALHAADLTGANRLDRARRWAVAAGLLIGIGAGARLDAALWFIIVGYLLMTKRLQLTAFFAAAGCFGLLLLALDNHQKVDVPFPFVYKRENLSRWSVYTRYIPALLAAIVLVSATLALRGKRTGDLLRRAFGRARTPTRTHLLGAALATSVLAAIWVTSGLFGGLVDIVVDLSALDPARIEPAMVRSPAGGVIYFDHYKKALLQSCPYLSVLILPLLDHRRADRSPAVWPLYLPLCLLTAVFAARSWHGGLSLNMRYLLPALPMTSVLAIQALRQIYPERGAGWLVAGGVTVSACLNLSPTLQSSWLLELRLLELPLFFSAVLLVACLRTVIDGIAPWRSGAGRAAFTIFTACFAWAGFVNLGYDYPAQRALRAHNRATALAVSDRIQTDSLLLMPMIDPFALLIDADKVRLANPFQDGLASLLPLVQHHLSVGRSVYGAFPWQMWPPVYDRLRAGGLQLSPPEPVTSEFVLARIGRSNTVEKPDERHSENSVSK